MNTIQIILLVAVGFLLAVMFYLVSSVSYLKQREKERGESERRERDIISKLSENVTRQISATEQKTDRVFERLGKLNSRLEEVGNSARAARDIKEMLWAPQRRGKFSEVSLYALARDILPDEVIKEQYAFTKGTQVDMVIKLGENILPIDSKFPLARFSGYFSSTEKTEKERQARKITGFIKKHIDDISSKYINPSEGTFEFAFMYIPSESIYYEIFAASEFEKLDIAGYARKKNVYPVSPNTLHAYLTAVGYAVRSAGIRRNIKQVFQVFGEVERSFEGLCGEARTLLRHIKNAYQCADRLDSSLSDVDRKLERTRDVMVNFSEEGGSKKE